MALSQDVIATMGLDSKSFEKGLRGARSRLVDFEKKIGRTNIALGALGVAGGAVGGLKKLGDFAEELDRTADRAGVSVEELQKFQTAAREVGVETDKISDSLEELSIRAEEAAKGEGQAIAAFNALGISLRNNQGQLRSTTDIFFDIANAFQNIHNRGRKVSLADQLFGGSGTETITTLLNQGRDALQGLFSAAEGDIISSGDVERMKEFNDALARLKTEFRGLVATTAPFLVRLVRGTTQVGAGLASVFERIKEDGVIGRGALRDAFTEGLGRERQRQFEQERRLQGIPEQEQRIRELQTRLARRRLEGQSGAPLIAPAGRMNALQLQGFSPEHQMLTRIEARLSSLEQLEEVAKNTAPLRRASTGE